MKRETLIYVLVLGAVGVALYLFWRNLSGAAQNPNVALAGQSTPAGVRASAFGQSNPIAAVGSIFSSFFGAPASSGNSPLAAATSVPSAPPISASDTLGGAYGPSAIALEPVAIPTTLTTPDFSSYATQDGEGTATIVPGNGDDITDSVDASYFG